MLVKVHKWHSATSKTWDTVNIPLSSLGSDYLLFDSSGCRVGIDCDLDEVHAVPVPKGVEAYIAIAVVTAIVTAAFLPKPEVPQNAGQSKTSPNNQPASQSNTSRLGQGKPDVRGTVKSFPDLAQSPWYYYDGNVPKVLQKFLVGIRGFSVSADIFIGETDINNIAGADYFWNGDGDLGSGASELGSYHAFYPARNDGVEELKIAAPDEIVAGITYMRLDSSTNTVSLYGTTRWGTPDGSFSFPEALEFNQTKSFSIDNLALAPTPADVGFFEYDTYEEVTEDVSTGGTGDNRTVHKFHITNRTISTSAQYGIQPDRFCNVRRGDTGADGWSEWQYIKPLKYAMLNLSWPQSILNSSGGPTALNWEIEYENNSGIQTITGTKEAFDNSPVYHSEMLNLTASATVSRFRVRRTTNYATARSDMIVDSCFSLGVYSGPRTGNGILSTTYRGGRYSSTPVTGNVSIIPQPEYYTYNGTAISLVTPGLIRNSFADSVLMDLILVYGNNLTLIKEAADIDELYDIDASLTLSERAFSYTFDDTDIDLESRIKTACNCARVIAYESNGKWRFTRDESKPVSAIFNRRNIAGSSDGDMSVSFNKPLDKNGVSVKYIDPNTFKEAYVHRSIDVASFTTAEPTRPLEIDLAGCSNTTQANNRADLEVRKLVYQRRSVKEKVLSDGLEVELGDRVKWASIYDDALSHGEVMEIIDGDNVRVSEPVTGTVYTHYTTVAGAIVGPITCTGSSSGFILTRTSGPSFASAFVADDDNQAGSMFIAGDTVDLNYADMTVVSISPNDDDTVDIEMTEYNELIYSED